MALSARRKSTDDVTSACTPPVTPPLPCTPVLHLYLCCVLMILLYSYFRVLSDISELEMSTSLLTEASFFFFFRHGWCRDLPYLHTVLSFQNFKRKTCGSSAVCGRAGELSGKISQTIQPKGLDLFLTSNMIWCWSRIWPLFILSYKIKYGNIPRLKLDFYCFSRQKGVDKNSGIPNQKMLIGYDAYWNWSLRNENFNK